MLLTSTTAYLTSTNESIPVTKLEGSEAYKTHMARLVDDSQIRMHAQSDPNYHPTSQVNSIQFNPNIIPNPGSSKAKLVYIKSTPARDHYIPTPPDTDPTAPQTELFSPSIVGEVANASKKTISGRPVDITAASISTGLDRVAKTHLTNAVVTADALQGYWLSIRCLST